MTKNGYDRQASSEPAARMRKRSKNALRFVQFTWGLLLGLGIAVLYAQALYEAFERFF